MGGSWEGYKTGEEYKDNMKIELDQGLAGNMTLTARLSSFLYILLLYFSTSKGEAVRMA